ncbi:hypothetical protein BRC83_05660 [Halobacteriales archaeon QS_1_68_17]|nr:MAG: hypothetical protein BRC83_05660 [Halobacteriales archaeon QS_1_68_17]
MLVVPCVVAAPIAATWVGGPAAGESIGGLNGSFAVPGAVLGQITDPGAEATVEQRQVQQDQEREPNDDPSSASRVAADGRVSGDVKRVVEDAATTVDGRDPSPDHGAGFLDPLAAVREVAGD